MIRSYITIAVRNILKHKLYAIINVAGLALGLACCILVVLFVQREFSFNQFHEKKDGIYRVLRLSEDDNNSAGTSGALGPALRDEFPVVEATVRVWGMPVWMLGNDKVFEQRLYLVDPNYFELFSFELLEGDPATVLREPNAIVITEDTAERYFGDEDPIGQTIQVDDLHFEANLTVAGVMRNMREDTSWHFWTHGVTSTIRTEVGQNIWSIWKPFAAWRPIDTYVLLREDAKVTDLQEQLPDFILRHLGEKVAAKDRYHLQAMERIWLYGPGDSENSWALQRIQSYVLIAVVILLIACINFMNLATARSMLRAQEVGLRKTVGASRLQLSVQFLAESVILSCIALVLGIGLARLLRPLFESFIDTHILLDTASIVQALPYLVLCAVVTGLVAGSYPALFLSRWQPLETLRGQTPQGRGSKLRKVLVVSQFAVAICLLVGTLIVQDQIDYVTNRPLGFDRENVIMLPLYELDRQSKPDAFHRIAFQNGAVKAEFLGHPDILKVSGGRFGPGAYPGMRRKWEPLDRPGEVFDIYVQEADDDYVDLFGLKLLAGRTFDGSIRDTASVMINRSAMERLGIENPVGKQVFWVTQNKRLLTIIGVYEDFQNQSLRLGVAPGALIQYPPLYYDLFIKHRPGTQEAVVPFLKEKWKQYLPNRPFRLTTLDQELSWHYWEDFQFRKTIQAFCGFAMFLACLGLYGLASFTAERRTKEIGVRKVLGASVLNLIEVMTREFVLLVGLANLIAWPLAYFYLNDWLNGFVQRIDLSAIPFLVGGFAVLLVALITIGMRTYAAAQSNPVDALRTE